MWNPMVKFSFLSVNKAERASDWDNWTITSGAASFSSTASTSNLNCGLFKNVSLWFKHPPARCGMNVLPSSGFPRPIFHDPYSWHSFQVLEKEKTDVLINRQMDISVNWTRKSSKGILKGRFLLLTPKTLNKNSPKLAVVVESQSKLLFLFVWNISPFWGSGK